jgi:hypothetical protein
MLGSHSPVDSHVVDQKRGDYLSAPVRHEPRQFQFHHVRVDYRVSGGSVSPVVEQLERLRPLSNFRGFLCAVKMEDFGSLLDCVEFVEITRSQLENHMRCAFVCTFSLFVQFHLFTYVSGTEATEGQPWREFRRIVSSQHSITRFFISF